MDNHYSDILLNLIFKKSLNESNFSYLYAKLLQNIITIYGDLFRIKLLDKVKDFYNKNILNTFNIENLDIDALLEYRYRYYTII